MQRKRRKMYFPGNSGRGGLERTLIKDVTKSGRPSVEEGPGFGTENGCDRGQSTAGGGVD